MQRLKAKSRNEIFALFGNKLQPIAVIPSEHLKYFDESMTDNRVYSGMGYMIDHAVNHHPEVAAADYLGIQDIIDNADDVKLDERNPNRNKSILFEKNVGKTGVVVVSFDQGENGKFVLQKTFFDKIKSGRFDKLPSIRENVSPAGANSTISPAQKGAAAVRLSALDDKIKVANEESSVKPKEKTPLSHFFYFS